VRFTHPNYDTQTRTVSVRGGDQVQRTFYFEQPVAIQVRHADAGNPIWASIFVDGTQVAQLTDFQTRLGPGTHRITVSRADFTVVTPPQDVTIEPGFEQRAPQAVVFQIRPQ